LPHRGTGDHHRRKCSEGKETAQRKKGKWGEKKLDSKKKVTKGSHEKLS